MYNSINEDKYKTLLGSEVEFTEVLFSELEHTKRRFDAEYYKRGYLRLQERINLIGGTTLKDLNIKLDCSAFYPAITEDYNFLGEGIPFLRVNEIQNGLINITNNTAFLPQSILDANKSTIATAQPDDIVIAKGGNSLAKLGLVTDSYPYYAICRDLILIRTKGLNNCNKYFLWVFLHSKYGQDLLWRTASQTGQPHLTLPSILEMKLPRFSIDFESKFEFLYKHSINQKHESNQAYSSAESLLLQTIGLSNFKPSNDPVNIKNFKDSFVVTGRLDAEYYQKKYEEIEDYIKSFKLGFTNVSDEFALSKEIIEKIKDYYNYTEISDVNVTDGSVTFNELPINDLPDNGKMVLREGQIIISKVRPYRGAIGIIRECPNNYVGSGAFTVLNEKSDYKKEVLQTLLRSKPYQELIMKYNVGSSYPVVKDEDILNLPIPKLENQKQQEIAALVEESFTLKKQSEQLLETAKRAVEIAIEQDEETALAFIKDRH